MKSIPMNKQSIRKAAFIKVMKPSLLVFLAEPNVGEQPLSFCPAIFFEYRSSHYLNFSQQLTRP